MNFRRLFAGAAATLTLMEKRAATALLIMLLTTATAWAENVTYIDEDGDEQTVEDASPIEDNLDPDHGWYYVEGNVTINSLIGNASDGGDIHIILCDGATLNITNEDGMAISLNYCNLYIYGQSAGTGKLIATSTYETAINTNGGDLTIAGGIVTATSTDFYAININGGDLTIAGGIVTATSTYVTAIETNGGDLTIDGGYVKATSTEGSSININGCSLTIAGGIVTATSTNNAAIETGGGNLTIAGGIVTATSTEGSGISVGGGSITLAGGYLKATSIDVGDGSITLAGGAVKASSYGIGIITIDDDLTYYDGTGAWYNFAIDLTDPAADVNDRILSTYEHLSGTCGRPDVNDGEDVTWSCDLESLTISGTGAMADYGSSSQPWKDFKQFITSVTIGDGVTSIGDYAFKECTSLTSVVIPASVTSIGINAFYGSALQRVYSLRPEAPVLGNNAFDYCNSLGAIVVPAAAYDSYNSGWSSYSSNLQSGYTVTCGAGVTATTYAPIVAEGETVTLGHNRTGYDFGGYESSDVTITDGTFTMPARDVTVSAAWTPSDNIALTANLADGNYWTTFYCGDADYTVATEGAYAYTAEVGTDAVTLTKRGADIPMGKAVIIVGGGNGTDASVSISLTKTSGLAAYDGTNHLHGVDVRTEKSTLGSGTFYVMGKQNSEFGFYEYTGQYMPARKAYFTVPATAGAHKFTMVFGDETGVTPLLSPEGEEGASPWYTLSGTRLNGKPATKGVYISNGRKIVIK